MSRGGWISVVRCLTCPFCSGLGLMWTLSVRSIVRRFASAAVFAALSASLLQAAEFGKCEIASTAPEAVAEALDKVLIDTVEPSAKLAGILGHAPGAVLSVVAPDWRYVRSFGLSDPNIGTPMDCGLPFEIGSNTKMMTAVVLLQLVEEGALGLDDPLSQHLPELAAALPNGQEMTLRQLARHTSGVFNYTDNAPDGTPGIMEGDLRDARRHAHQMAALNTVIDEIDVVILRELHGAQYEQ